MIKRERASRFAVSQKECEDGILAITTRIHQLKEAIRDLDLRRKAEEAETLNAAVNGNGWSTWLQSPLSKKPRAESAKEKQQKMKERIDRLHTRTFKEKKLQKSELDLRDKKKVLERIRVGFHAANANDDDLTSEVEERIRLRRVRAQQKKDTERKVAEAQERAEHENLKQRMKQRSEREEKERAREKEEAGEGVESNSEQRSKDKGAKKQQQKEDSQKTPSESKPRNNRAGSQRPNHAAAAASASTARSARGLCVHTGCWLRIEGSIACGYCYKNYDYLLQCPDCKMDACPACQQTLRPW